MFPTWQPAQLSIFCGRVCDVTRVNLCIELIEMARVAAGPVILNAISSQDFIRDSRVGLAAMSASDAKHDLKETFSSIYSAFKDVGTPVMPVVNPPLSEINVLDSILHFQTGEQTYRSNYLSEDLGGQKASPTPFQVFTNGPAYQWKSWHVGKRNAAQTGVDWANAGVKVNATSLFDWLDIQKTKKIAFTVDATCVPLFRVFKDGLAFAGSRTAYNILTREGVSDSAGKGPQSEHSGGVVQIVDLYDYAGGNVPTGKFYLHTPRNAPANKDDPNDCFFSKFDISVSAISKQENLNCISMDFMTPGFVKHINTLKGSKEEAHSGTKNAAVEQITGFLAKLGLSPALQPNINDKNNYYVQIQQKRSGDWLQVLACHDMGRFRLLGLPKDCNEIFLITHDQICVAYALVMGINVLYAQYNDTDKKYWLTFFHKDTKTVPQSTVLTTYVSDIRNSHKDIDYIAKREAYIAMQESIYVELVTKLQGAMDPDPGSIENLEKVLKDILERALDIAYFLQTMPVLEADGTGEFYTTYIAPPAMPVIAPGITNDAAETIYKNSGIFKRNKAKIDKHPDLSRTRSIFVGSSEKTRNNFLKDTRLAIQYIQIKQRMFSRIFDLVASERRQGAGVFSFLNANLTGATKFAMGGMSKSPIQAIRDWLLNVKTPFIARSGNDNKNWGVIKGVAFLTLGDDGAAAGGAGVAGVAGVSLSAGALPNGELLQAVAIAKDITIGALTEKVLATTVADENAPAVEKGANNQLVQAEEYLRKAIAEVATAEGNIKSASYASRSLTTALTNAQRKRDIVQAEVDAAKATTAPVVAPVAPVVTVATVAPVATEATVDKKETSVFVVSDFQPAVVIAATRAREVLTKEAPGLLAALDANERDVEIRQTYVGGAIPDHNPHTTFYFLLRELGFRFTLDYLDHHEAVYNLAYFILNIYNNIDAAIAIGFTERKYLTALEFFVLKTMREANADFHDIITDVTRNYFGFDKISESYNVSYTLPEDIKATLFEVPIYEPSRRLEYIPYIDSLMGIIIERCVAMEAQEQAPQYTLPTRVPSMIPRKAYTSEGVRVSGGRRTYKRTTQKKRRTIRRKHLSKRSK